MSDGQRAWTESNTSATIARRVIGGLHRLTFSDSETVGLIADLNAVFNELSFPDDDQVEELTLRLRGALLRLIGAAENPYLRVQSVDVFTLVDAIKEARTRLDEETLSVSSLAPRVVLVRLAWNVSDLLDVLGPVFKGSYPHQE
ncbi:DUF6415 family natural product biosynthesis protein [[Kitasatospora] papulosa]|uniref:DUF6415 family natural product biosynthesis protein n=1 Tax=[Kitasatospora] papulosa TaxID=1464011 RepID=UPI00369F4E65